MVRNERLSLRNFVSLILADFVTAENWLKKINSLLVQGLHEQKTQGKNGTAGSSSVKEESCSTIGRPVIFKSDYTEMAVALCYMTLARTVK